MPRIKQISKWLQAGFYVVAGVNHFVNPAFYYPLIPPFFGHEVFINLAAGVVEIALGLGLLLPVTRKYAAWAIVLMLVAFIPSHVYFIQRGGCIEGGLCVPVWIGWFRLIVIHPFLILWARSGRR